ncbi:hypothetical protein [Burkholderia sp. MS455]|uniref:hypothetical protein n=1 Tax=Burkholderia sp. MS455 TaxID=2811788 RepID=UPI0019574373|nr:hypothetical protein [Burkholderia sp. MS455]
MDEMKKEDARRTFAPDGDTIGRRMRAVPEDALPRCHGMKSGLDDLPGSGSQRR